MARKTLDENVTHDEVDGGYMMGAAMIVRVNPTVQWNGTAGNNSYEWVWRDIDGGNYLNSGGGGVPAYPNAWLRIQRTGQTFTGYSSSDGVTWVNIGTHDFPADTPLPDKLFVGPYYSPEGNNNGTAAGIGHSTVAKFRDYGAFGETPGPGETSISISRGAGGALSITFEGGRLQVATRLAPNPDWQDVAGATSPYPVNTSGSAVRFYRVLSP
jgi:hypothetical protein